MVASICLLVGLQPTVNSASYRIAEGTTHSLSLSLSIQRSSCLPDENNVAALQEEVKQMKLRELETLRSFREMQDTVAELNQRWQVARIDTVAFPCKMSACARPCSVKGEFHLFTLCFCSIICPAAAAQAVVVATGRNPQRRTP